MEVSVTKASDGRTKVRVYNPSPGAFIKQRFRLYPPDGADPIDSAESSGFDSLEWVFYIEDYADRFITPYPTQRFGYFDIAVEKKFFVGDAWDEKEKVKGVQYPIDDNEWTRPSIDSITYAPSELLLGSAVYVKGKNGVAVSNLSASGKYGASVVDIKWQVEGVAYSVGSTSATLKSYGQIPITLTATDSRGITTTRTDYITVYDYYKPYISPVHANDRVIVGRTDNSGAFVDGGTLLRVEAGKRWADVGGLNRCALMYRIKATTEEWSEYKYLLTPDTKLNDYNTNVPITLDEHVAYKFELVVEDSFGEWEVLMFDLLTEEVYMYRSGTRKSIAFGGHVTKDNAFEVYFGAHFYGGLHIDPVDGVPAGIVLGSSTSDKKFILTVNDSGTLSVSEYEN